MSRTGTSLPASADPTDFGKTTHWDPLKNDVDIIQLGNWCRNQYGGGDETNGLGIGVGTGYVTALNSIEFEIDNTSGQISGSTNLVCQARVSVRVVDSVSPASGISVTPRVYNVTDSSVPAQSGAAACTATAEDFTGSNQKQTISFTPATGKKKYVVQVAKSADSDVVIACRIAFDLYMNN